MSEHSDPVSAGHPEGSGPRRRRQSRALVTRESILAAAAQEFAESSYHEASLSRILERSKVTKGALYFHFSSKESIALAVVDMMEVLCREIVARARAGAVDPLRTAVTIPREVQDSLSRPVLVAGQRLCSEGFAGPHRPGWPYRYWESVFGDLFAAARRDGLLRSEIDPPVLARFVVDFSAGAFVTSLGTSALADLSARVVENWEIVLGLAAEPRWLAGWRAEGGMRRLLAPHLGPPLEPHTDPAPGLQGGGGSPRREAGRL